MTARQSLIDLVERIPEEDVPVVRAVLARFARGLTVTELRSIADSASPDPEPLSEGEREGFAEAEEYLAGRGPAVPYERVSREPHLNSRR